ncbi:alpha/beta hydrolase [Kitasatospora sp. NPDC018619]|uniref:alpha/beta hydrolase n=1 Tax=unclassified Kitasatospora TaxID=2633591 RepID=UPI0037B0EBDF
MTAEMVPQLRQADLMQVTDEQLAADGLTIRDVTIAGFEGDDITVSVITRRDHRGTGPGIYNTHGGGMVTGNRFAAIGQCIPWVQEHDAVLVTVEYRLAPEYPDPYPIEDCYAGLVWTAEHAHELGIDPSRLIIAGPSAGGGLAAGTALLARDRKGPALAGQVLMYPMLDDRNQTASRTSSMASASGTAAATSWAGPPSSATAAAPRTSPPTPRPHAPPTCPGSRPRSSK